MASELPCGRIRKQRGLSLVWVADELSISPAYLRRLELGHAPIPYVLARRLGHLYGVRSIDLIVGD